MSCPFIVSMPSPCLLHSYPLHKWEKAWVSQARSLRSHGAYILVTAGRESNIKSIKVHIGKGPGLRKTHVTFSGFSSGRLWEETGSRPAGGSPRCTDVSDVSDGRGDRRRAGLCPIPIPAEVPVTHLFNRHRAPAACWASSREGQGPGPVLMECPFPRRNTRGRDGPSRWWGVPPGRQTAVGQGGSDT